jgi:hypothetical protein
MSDSNQPRDSNEVSAAVSGAGGSRFDRVVAEIRDHPFGYCVLAVFMLAGPIAASLLFPEAPIGVSIVGGLALGGYAALCAVPQKFL